MSPNDYRAHILILPEDDANRQLANGFVLGLPNRNQRQIQVLRSAGGWPNVVSHFERQHVAGLDHVPDRRIVLLIDFDGDVDQRVAQCKEAVPARHTDRVFVLGVRLEPEDLRRLRPGSSFESIGTTLAKACGTPESDLWMHELLAHNASERARLKRSLPGLFH